MTLPVRMAWHRFVPAKTPQKMFATVGLAVFFSTQSFSFLKYLDELRQQHRH